MDHSRTPQFDPYVDPAPSGSKKVVPGPSLWVHSFIFQGRTFTIHKRIQSKDAPYYIRLMIKGRIYKKSLEVNSKQEAIDRAKVFVESVLTGKWKAVETLKVRRGASTLAQLLEVYRAIAKVQPITLKNNQDAVRWIFRTVQGDYEPTHIPLTAFCGTLVSRFQQICQERAEAGGIETPDARREARERALRTSRSVIRQARSLFNRRHRMLDQYEARGLVIPRRHIEEFMSCRVEGRDRKPEYFPPSDEVVQQAFAAIEDQKHQPKIYIAFWLAVGAGLRRGEIGRMRWEYIVERQGRAWISGSLGKDGERIEVPLQDRAAKALEPFRKPEGKCIEQESLEWARKLNNWMESQGWSTEKKMHELRAYTGSLIYQQDPIWAMMFLRHKSIKQTEGFYVRYSKGHKSIQVL
jgi:integrase